MLLSYSSLLQTTKSIVIDATQLQQPSPNKQINIYCIDADQHQQPSPIKQIIAIDATHLQ